MKRYKLLKDWDERFDGVKIKAGSVVEVSWEPDDVSMFEEIKEPESQERVCGHCCNGNCPMGNRCRCPNCHPQPQEKEECKHAWELKRDKSVVCFLCGLSERVLKPQPKQLPSEWIEKKKRFYLAAGASAEYAWSQAVDDFLDEHSHLFTK